MTRMLPGTVATRTKCPILLVDDEPYMLSALKRLLRAFPSRYGDTEFDIAITAFSSPQAALDDASQHRFELVITDYRMPDMDGIDFLTRLRKIQPDMARILLTSAIDPTVIQTPPEAAGIDRYLAKPCNDHLLLDTIAELLHQRSHSRGARVAYPGERS